MLTVIDGILVLFSRGLGPAPSTIAESVQAFADYSRFPVFSVNAAYGLPERIASCRFRVIVLHYTLFYDGFSPLTASLRRFLGESADSYLVTMFQDEQSQLPERIDFCERYGVDCVYTAVEPPHSQRLYGGNGRSVLTYLPGYVSKALRAFPRSALIPDERRKIDIGYRGRKAPAEWGEAAREKHEIAVGFRVRAARLGLQLDIEVDESKRIYGRDWHRFIADCRAMLGTESGTGVLPWLLPTDETVGTPTLKRHTGGSIPAGWTSIPYRTVAPRHFEAAALKSCQILFEGRYSDVLKPMVHYIPLKRDFANFAQVIEAYRDSELRAQLTEQARCDIIDSNKHSYADFVGGLDRHLAAVGVAPQPRRSERLRYARAVGPAFPSHVMRLTKAKAWWYLVGARSEKPIPSEAWQDKAVLGGAPLSDATSSSEKTVPENA